MRLRRGMVLEPDTDGRVLVDAAVFAFQILIPPAHALLQEADGRARHAALRLFVAPWPDQALAWRLEVLDQPQHRPGIAVEPAADCKDRAFDGAPVLAD